VSRPDLGPT